VELVGMIAIAIVGFNLLVLMGESFGRERLPHEAPRHVQRTTTQAMFEMAAAATTTQQLQQQPPTPHQPTHARMQRPRSRKRAALAVDCRMVSERC